MYVVAVGLLTNFEKERSHMQILKSIGGAASGWAKFLVTLLAMGWFGVYAIDRLTSDGDAVLQDVTQLDAEKDALGGADSSISENYGDPATEEGPNSPNSAVGAIGSELWSGLHVFLSNQVTTLVLAFLAGGGLGLAGRPVLTHMNQRRRLRAAVNRQRLYEQDRQLLASSSEASVASATDDPLRPVSESVAAHEELAPGPRV